MDPSELDQMLDLDPTEEFKFTVPKDPYLSPYFATDEQLKQLPPVKIIVSILNLNVYENFKLFFLLVSAIGSMSGRLRHVSKEVEKLGHRCPA